MKLVLKSLLPAAGISILAALPCAAQTANAPSPIVPATPAADLPLPKRMHELYLRFVKPSLMAFWLDSTNNAPPPELQSNAASQGAQIRVRIPLPAGVDRVIGVDPANMLLIFGTDEGVQELQRTIQFLDRPQRKIAVEARLVTIKTEAVSGIWAALSEQTGRGTPAAAFLKPDEELELGGQIARLEARFERTQILNLDSGAAQILDFGPPTLTSPMRPRDFSSQMPVIPPPNTGDDMRTMHSAPRPLSPFNGLQLQVQSILQSDGSVSLELRDLARRDLGRGDLGQGAVLGRANFARFEMHANESLALALSDSTRGTRAFLLLSTPNIQLTSSSKIPLLGDLPSVGELFRSPKAPPKEMPKAP